MLSRLSRHVVPPAQLVGKSATTRVEVETADSSECFCYEELDIVLNLIHGAASARRFPPSWLMYAQNRQLLVLDSCALIFNPMLNSSTRFVCPLARAIGFALLPSVGSALCLPRSLCCLGAVRCSTCASSHATPLTARGPLAA